MIQSPKRREAFKGERHPNLKVITGNILTCPGRDLNPGSGERQLAVRGNALDHTADGHQGRPGHHRKLSFTIQDICLATRTTPLMGRKLGGRIRGPYYGHKSIMRV